MNERERWRGGGIEEEKKEKGERGKAVWGWSNSENARHSPPPSLLLPLSSLPLSLHTPPPPGWKFILQARQRTFVLRTSGGRDVSKRGGVRSGSSSTSSLSSLLVHGYTGRTGGSINPAGDFTTRENNVIVFFLILTT